MRVIFVIVGFSLLIITIVLACFIYEVHVEEVVIEKWDPITPSSLNPGNITGWAFAALTQNGTFLELNISASEPVRVIIGRLVSFDPTTKEEVWEDVIFNQTGTIFKQKVEIAGKNADFLQIKNERTNSVSISGDVKKIGEVTRSFYPYTGLGTITALLSVSMLTYGILAKSRVRMQSKTPAKALNFGSQPSVFNVQGF
ncbi:MAG: hypothetical protein QXQ94_06970 [Candidatus Bathyarchaeia archaeon]